MKYRIRVKANHECWIANWEGDPGRTSIKENAMIYVSKAHANRYLEFYEFKYPNRSFSIEQS